MRIQHAHNTTVFASCKVAIMTQIHAPVRVASFFALYNESRKQFTLQVNCASKSHFKQMPRYLLGHHLCTLVIDAGKIAIQQMLHHNEELWEINRTTRSGSAALLGDHRLDRS